MSAIKVMSKHGVPPGGFSLGVNGCLHINRAYAAKVGITDKVVLLLDTHKKRIGLRRERIGENPRRVYVVRSPAGNELKSVRIFTGAAHRFLNLQLNEAIRGEARISNTKNGKVIWCNIGAALPKRRKRNREKK